MWINYDILDLNSNVPHQGRLEMLRAWALILCPKQGKFCISLSWSHVYLVSS